MYTLHVYIDRCLKDHILNIVVQPTIDPTGNEVIYPEGSFEQMSNWSLSILLYIHNMILVYSSNHFTKENEDLFDATIFKKQVLRSLICTQFHEAYLTLCSIT